MAKKPNIRFAGFEDDWEQRKLGEVAEIIGGGTPSTSNDEYWDGEIDWYAPAEIGERIYLESSQRKITEEGLNKSSAKILPIGTVLFTSRAGIGKTAILLKEGCTNQGFQSIVPNKEKLDSYFIFTRSEELKRYGETVGAGSTFVEVSGKQMANMELMMPKTMLEQQQIGKYFSTLDHLITLHQRKCDELKKVKKFMLQKMFPKKGEKNPEIRFDGFTNDWEQRKLGEVCVRVTRKNKNNESDLPLTIASQYGLIDQRDFFNKVIAAKDMSNYYLLKKGEFAYNKSYSKGFDYGSIKRLNAYEQGCLSTLYICFSIETDEVDSDYLECFFDTLSWYHDVSAICAEGARNHGLLNVDVEAFFKDVNIEMPSQIQEQRKISVFINTLDHLITLHQRKCEELKNVKKYMLQNMFAKGE